MNAVGASGLQLYNFGQTVSLVFFTDSWKPDSFYDRIKENSDLGMHTLILLDIKVKEQSEENLARYGRICLVIWLRIIVEIIATEEGRFMDHRGTCQSLKLYHSSQKSRNYEEVVYFRPIKPSPSPYLELEVGKVRNELLAVHLPNWDLKILVSLESHCIVWS